MMCSTLVRVCLGVAVAASLVLSAAAQGAGRQPRSAPPQRPPNILLIMGDDIGIWNLSYMNRGMMEYSTPNIDRLAAEGMTFTDYYGEQSCTAGRAAFITGQSPVRTGLTKVGIPGSPLGLQPEDPTLAELLKPLGYATGQFGKNHLGDRNEFLPTVHGFDEFFGNLYHLNAEEEPENPDYFKDPKMRARFLPRGVIRSWATDRDDPEEDPRFGRVGRQRIEDTGPLTRKRMETVDDEFLEAAIDFIERQHDAGTPWLCWFNSTRMHIYTHIRPEHEGLTPGNFYADGMVEHDMQVGELLDLLDRLGIAENTIVVYTTDNGPHFNEWPDGGITPFRSEKNTSWEGAFRVPCIVRWPGRIQAGVVSNEIMSHTDWVPTLLAAAGVDDARERLRAGQRLGDRMYRVHLDGYNFLPYLTGSEERGPRREFFYFTDDGDLAAIRYDNWKSVFLVQRAHGFDVWREPFVKLRVPYLFNLRRDPFERAQMDSNNYNHWSIRHAFAIAPTQAIATRFLETFREFPPRQKPAAFNLDDVMRRLQEAPMGGD